MRDMEHQTLSAALRTIHGRATNELRAAGQVPAVLYGFGTEPMSITVDRNAFAKVYDAAGESTVVHLDLDGTRHPVIIADIQRDVIRDHFTHADFRRVDLTQKMEAKIPLALTGESAAVKTLGGTLLQSLEEIEVFCLPDALVHEIPVSVEALATFDDVIRVRDIVIPAGIEVKTDPEVAVASVQPPRSEAEMAALDAAVEVDVSKIEVLTEKKEGEGEAAAEGATEAKKE